VSKEQRAELEQRAVGMSLNAYVLSCLFDNPKKKRRSRQPTKRDKALARALSSLGHSGIAGYLTSQLSAVQEGRLHLSEDEERQLRKAYDELYRVRSDLVAAAGLQSEYDP
jgi:hypothetical protein